MRTRADRWFGLERAQLIIDPADFQGHVEAWLLTAAH